MMNDSRRIVESPRNSSRLEGDAHCLYCHGSFIKAMLSRSLMAVYVTKCSTSILGKLTLHTVITPATFPYGGQPVGY